MSSKIIFLNVKTNKEKLFSITNYVEKYFNLAQKILILTPNEEVSHYIDELLWRFQPESFIPHTICNEPCNEQIVITNQPINLNKSPFLFNLSQNIPPCHQEFEIIYELYDETHPLKLEASKKQYAKYQQITSKITLENLKNCCI